MTTFTPPSLEQRVFYQSRPANQTQVMVQSWRELLFLHWSIEPDEIQATLPPGLKVDTFDGKAWLGIVPFYMRGIRPRFLPPVPGISNFLEVNLRTYVYSQDGTPGVWFYSLDANQWLAVRVARTLFHLPYYDAKMGSNRFPVSVGEPIDYLSERKGEANGPSNFKYKSGKVLGPSEPGSFEFFLLERYILFAYNQKRKQLYTGQVHHTPYERCAVEVEAYDTRLAGYAGFNLGGRQAEHVAMSRGVDVDVFMVQAH